jgi:hypothetical protein
MHFLTNASLVLLYFLMLPLSLFNRMLGGDPLQLRRPRAGASCWLVRGKRPTSASYFSEESELEGRATHNEEGTISVAPGTGKLMTPLFLAVARMHAPRRAAPGEKFSAAAEREQGIPDEVYTLW